MLDHTPLHEPRVRMAAVGDILLTPPPAEEKYRRSLKLVADDAASILAECDLTFGNLECTLAAGGQRVPTEPRVFATPELVRAVRSAGFDVVTLANNHMFDGLEPGYQKLHELLEELSLPHFGAGVDFAAAARPTLLEREGIRIAFLGAVDRSSGPFRFATADTSGVAPLDIPRLCAQIQELRTAGNHGAGNHGAGNHGAGNHGAGNHGAGNHGAGNHGAGNHGAVSHGAVHHVIVSLHWGEERFSIPSPQQVQQARELIDAGASMILGHHPHVLQGLEIYRGAPIIYSLGNFLADKVFFSSGDSISWNRRERTGSILVTELSRDAVRVIRQIPTHDDGERVCVDRSGYGERRIEKLNRELARGIGAAQYQREHRWINVVRPTIEHLRPSQLCHLRLRHARKALGLLLHSRPEAGRPESH